MVGPQIELNNYKEEGLGKGCRSHTVFEETEWLSGVVFAHHCTESLQVRPKAWNLDIIISKPEPTEASEVNTQNEKTTEFQGVTLNNLKI